MSAYCVHLNLLDIGMGTAMIGSERESQSSPQCHDHCFLLSDFGDLYMWGWNEKGQLGLTVSPDNDDDSHKIQCQALPALVNLPEDLDVLAVSCGTRHTAIVAGKRIDLTLFSCSFL